MTADTPTDIVAEAEAISARLATLRAALGKVVIGQEAVITQTLVTLLAGGHGLLVGVPGLAKTLLVESLGTVLGLDARRVQFTPDLMPSDILGAEVLETGDDGRRSFRFIEGPVFCQLLMADEINRASPRTQSALLQAMQERQVTVAGQARPMPRPFHVLATQNPLEQEGTYPLPEAQLDRFLLEIDVDFPARAAEAEILRTTTGAETATLAPVLSAEELIRAQALVRRMPVPQGLLDAILDLVRQARPGTEEAPEEVSAALAWGPGPRAAQALSLGVRARALIEGRLAPDGRDLVALALPALKHRMALGYAARAEGVTARQIVDGLLARADLAGAA